MHSTYFLLKDIDTLRHAQVVMYHQSVMCSALPGVISSQQAVFFFSAVPTSALSSTSTLRLLHSLTVFWQKRILLNALQGVGVGGGSNSCTYTDHSEDVFPARGMLTTQQVLRLYCTLVYGGHRHWRTLGICLKTFWVKVDRNVTFPRLKLDKGPLRCCYLKPFWNWGKRLFF